VIVTVTPPLGEPYLMEVDPSRAQIRWNIFGGPLDARLPGRVFDSRRGRLMYAHILIDLGDGRGWEGDGWNSPVYGGNDGQESEAEDIYCLGVNNALSESRRTALYADTALQPWGERGFVTKNKDMRTQSDSALLRIIYPKDTALPNGAATGMMRRIPRTQWAQLEGHWTRPTTGTRLRFMAGQYVSGEEGESINWKTPAAGDIAAGSGATSGDAAIEFGAAALGLDYIDFLNWTATIPTGYTPADDQSATLSNLVVRGVEGVLSPTVGAVALDVLENECPTWALPAGDVYRTMLEDFDDPIEPLVFEQPCDAVTKLKETLKYAAGDFGWRRLRIGTKAFFLPRQAARSDAPRWLVDVRDERVTHSLAGLDLEQLVTHVNVAYQDVDGRTIYTERTQPDLTAYLNYVGRPKVADLSVDTTSLARAQAFGDLYLAEHSRDRVSGTITVPFLRSVAGGKAPLCRLREGDMVRIVGLKNRAVNARVTEVATAGGKLQLTVDSSPYALEIALAQLSKRETSRAA
jgi:hypothetical protein